MLAMLGTSELTQVVWTLAAVVEQNSPNTIRQPVRAWRERESRGLLLVSYIQHQQTVADLPGWLLDSQEHTGPGPTGRQYSGRTIVWARAGRHGLCGGGSCPGRTKNGKLMYGYILHSNIGHNSMLYPACAHLPAWFDTLVLILEFSDSLAYPCLKNGSNFIFNV